MAEAPEVLTVMFVVAISNAQKVTGTADRIVTGMLVPGAEKKMLSKIRTEIAYDQTIFQ
jgi:hypothetical protein